MIELLSAAPAVQAVAVVAVVFLQAVVLYVGYSWLESIVGRAYARYQQVN